jgi:hypothetical protein
MNDEALEFIWNIGLVSDIIPFIVLFTILSKIHRKMWWTLFFVSTSWMISDCLSGVFAFYSFNNHIIINIYTLVSTIVYLYLYTQMSSSLIYKRIVWAVNISCVGLSTIVLFFYNGWYSHAPIIDVFTGIIPLILSLLFFYDLFKSLRVPNLLAYPFYWINSAIMVHFGVTFYSFVFFGVFSDNIELFSYIWLFVLMSNIIYNILFARGLWLMKRT